MAMCDFCNFVCRRVESDRFFKHLATFHANEPNFTVYCASCPQSFKKVNSLQKHYYRRHKPFEDQNGDGCSEDEHNMGHPVDEFEEATAQQDYRHHVAKFLLGAREQGKLTQSSLEMVKDSTKNLLTEYSTLI